MSLHNAYANTNGTITLFSFQVQMSMYQIIVTTIVIMTNFGKICHGNNCGDGNLMHGNLHLNRKQRYHIVCVSVRILQPHQCHFDTNLFSFDLFLQGRDLTIAYFLVAITYLFVGVLFYITFPKKKNCIADVSKYRAGVRNKILWCTFTHELTKKQNKTKQKRRERKKKTCEKESFCSRMGFMCGDLETLVFKENG